MEKHIVYSGTSNLYPWMAQAAKGAWAHSAIDKVHFLIDDEKFPIRIPDFVEVHPVREIAEKKFPLDCVNRDTTYTHMALIRVCYGSLFPNLDRIFQLDIDTVVVDDITTVWDTKMDNKWMAAAHENFGSIRFFGKRYYNVGTALFNLKQIREDDIEKDLVRWLNDVRTPYVDQDAWVKFCVENKKDVRLDTRYNEAFMVGYTDNPAVIHFAGFKGWDTNMHAPRREYLRREMELSWDDAKRMHEALLEKKAAGKDGE